MRQLRKHLPSWLSSFGILLLLAGCQGESSAPSESTENASESTISDADMQQQQDQALAAQKKLFERLSGRLMEVMSKDGPVAAINVCSQEALQITDEVAKEHGVSMGRTSFRLRNSKNTAPAWASSLIQQRVAEPKFMNLTNGQLGALLPIKLQPQCLLCHGAPESIPPEVKQVLAANYPDDQATGFEPDQLRGWVWVEVPPVDSDAPSSGEEKP